MKAFKTFIVVFFGLLLSILIFQTTCESCFSYEKLSNNSCTKEDYEYAEFWNYYDPEKAYGFGLEVQKIFEEKNKDKLLNLLSAELSNGPRRKFILENKFDDIFPQQLIEKVIQSDVPCSPNGWRGFTIGNGLIWYNLNNNDNWNIFSINGANVEKRSSELPFWEIEGKIIHPSCFNKPLISGDNFEELADKYSIQDIENFFNTPGQYYGKNITNFSKVIPSWCSDNNSCEKISIGHTISECPEVNFYKDKDINVWEFHTYDKDTKGIYQLDEKKYHNQEYFYSNLINLDTDVCRKLAPYFKQECSKASLIEVGDYSGGTFGWHFAFAIYGVYDLSDVGNIILPLMFFSTKNDALNFVEELTKNLK